MAGTGTLHVSEKLLNGTAASGDVLITVNTTDQQVRDPAGNVVFSGPLTVKLFAGEASLTLPASDDATLSPTGFTYTVTAQLKHQGKSDYRRASFTVAAGSTVHFADIASDAEVAEDPSYGASLNGALGEVAALREGTDADFEDRLASSFVGTPRSTVPDAVDVPVFLSKRLRDLRVSPDPGERKVILAPEYGWEDDVNQEPQLFYTGDRWHCIFSAGNASALGYAVCDANGDPLNPDHWTKAPNAIIGQGHGGESGAAYHSGVYVEGSTIHVTATVDNVHMNRYTATVPSGGTTPTFTKAQSDVIAMGDVPGTVTLWGNSRISKDGTTYYLDFDTNADNWQTGYATATAVSGPWTVEVAQNQLQSLWPFQPYAGGLYNDTPVAQGGNVHIIKQNGEWIAFYHVGPKVTGGIPTDGYKAVSSDREVWTVLHGERPFLRRAHPDEVDQVADLCPAQGPNGEWVMLWDGYDNPAVKARIMGGRLLPTLMVNDIEGDPFPAQSLADASHGVLVPGKSSVTERTADFSTSSTSFTDMVSAYHYPTGTSVVVDVAVCGALGTTNYTYMRVVESTTSQTKPLGRFNTPVSATQSLMGGKALFTGLTPGKLYQFKVQVKVAADSFYMRPSLDSGTDEHCVIEVRDAAYPTPAP